MINKIYICCKKNEFLNLLVDEFKTFENVTILKKSTKEFMYNDEFDIINLPTSLLRDFGSIPGDTDCTVIETRGKYGLPKYAVTSPNFLNSKYLGNRERAWFQIAKPLEAALNFSIELHENLSYAIHTEYSFSYLEAEAQNVIVQCNILKDLLKKISKQSF